MSTLTHIPDVVLNRILEDCDFRAIICLRKVCRDLRCHIDRAVPDVKLSHLDVYAFEGFVVVEYGESGKVKYEENEKGYSVQSKSEEEPKILENLNYLNVFFEDLKFMMKHQKSILNKCAFLRRVPDKKFDMSPFFSRLMDTLKSKSTPLKTENLVVEVCNEDEVMATLPYFDAEILNDLWIIHPLNKRPVGAMPIRRIVELKQWKKARLGGIPGSYVANDCLKHFLHLHSSLLHVDTVRLDDLEFLKNNFLLAESFEECDFNYKTLDFKEEELSNLYGAPLIEETHSKRFLWFFKRPRSEKVLKVEHESSENPRFSFINTEKEHVPVGATVRDVEES